MKYPKDFLNQIICGNCLQIIKELPDNILDGVLIDPPYGEQMGYEGDDTPEQAEDLLSLFLTHIEQKVKRNGHVVIFWTMRNLDSCIDILRSSGFFYRRTVTMYLPKGNARPYLGWLPRTQAIVVGQKYLPKKPTEFHTEMAAYLNKALTKSKFTKSEVAKVLGCDSRLIMKWTRINDPAWCLPTPRFYRPLKELLKLDDQFDILLHRKPVHEFNKNNNYIYKHDTYIVNDKLKEEKLHPSQKPLNVIEHLASCIAPVGGVIFDGFSGSGTTAIACQNTGRKFIAVEISPEFHKISRKRLYKEE